MSQPFRQRWAAQALFSPAMSGAADRQIAMNIAGPDLAEFRAHRNIPYIPGLRLER